MATGYKASYISYINLEVHVCVYVHIHTDIVKHIELVLCIMWLPSL